MKGLEEGNFLFRLNGLRWTVRALSLLLLCLPTAARAQGPRADVASSPFSAAPYVVGEKLSYNVSFSNFPTAAHVELLVAGRGQFSGREGIELRAHVETIGVVSAALYSINNDYVTFVDPATGLPYRSRQTIREGGRSEDVSNDLNAGSLGNPAMPSTETNAAPGAFDFVSALYRLRALPLAPGAVYNISVQHGDRLYNAELRVTGRELVKTNVGSSNTLVTQVRVRGNDAADDMRVRVYFTDDERHVPVLVTLRLRAGEVRAELASTEIVPPAEATPGGVTPPLAQPTPRTTNTPLMPGVTPPPTRPGGSTAAATPDGAAPLPELPFKVGEELNFNFFLGKNEQPVGTASFRVRARARYFNRDGLLLTGAMRTIGAAQNLFQVNDQINSYVDATTLVPFRTELSLVEGRRQNRWVVSLDQNGGAALFDDGTRVDMPVNTHDLISVLYALRSFDLTPSKRTAVSLLVNKRPRPLYVVALSRANIQLGGQQIPAVELALTTGEAQADQLSLRLWVSADRRRLPLRLTALTPLGPVRADLAIIPATLQ